MTDLPKLYKVDSHDKVRVWSVSIQGPVVFRTYGFLDGKLIHSERTFEGKNVGRANETSAEEQALYVANKEWVDQLSKGYEPRCREGKLMQKKVLAAQEVSGGHGINAVASISNRPKKQLKTKTTLSVPGGEAHAIQPMKATVWKDTPTTTSYFGTHAYVQPKLDGWRCTAMVTPQGVVLCTNTGKQYPWFQAIRTELQAWWKACGSLTDDIVCLDGELFAPYLTMPDGQPVTMEARFNMIQSICGLAKSAPHVMEDQLQYHIFDVVTRTPLLQDQRFALLKVLFDKLPLASPHLVQVPTVWAPIDSVSSWHDTYAQEGYEGIMIRAKDLLYETDTKRSLKLRKYKHFIDAEYPVVGTLLDKGVGEERFVWQCQTPDGRLFKATPMGTLPYKRDLWAHRNEYIGRQLTVKFQDYTKDGIPRFPIAKAFRDDLD